MAFDIKKAEARLQNIEAVTPVLAALRTISLGSWQMSLSRGEHLSQYADRLLTLVPYLLPHISDTRSPIKRWLSFSRSDDREKPSEGKRSIVAVVMGSERGLCGQYNQILIDRLATYLQKKEDEEVAVSLVALGSRLIRDLRKQDYEPDVTHTLSVTRLPSYDLAREFVGPWLADYEAYVIDAVDVIYNAEVEAANYDPRCFRLIPPALPLSESEQDTPTSSPHAEDVGVSVSVEDVIVDSDPVGVYARIIEQWTTTMAYQLMLEASSTEHAARYQLMESATQNADELIEKLTRDIKTGRRRAITQEMQELAVAAGLLSE